MKRMAVAKQVENVTSHLHKTAASICIHTYFSHTQSTHHPRWHSTHYGKRWASLKISYNHKSGKVVVYSLKHWPTGIISYFKFTMKVTALQFALPHYRRQVHLARLQQLVHFQDIHTHLLFTHTKHSSSTVAQYTLWEALGKLKNQL